jgi:hypothetical protein
MQAKIQEKILKNFQGFGLIFEMIMKAGSGSKKYKRNPEIYSRKNCGIL